MPFRTTLNISNRLVFVMENYNQMSEHCRQESSCFDGLEAVHGIITDELSYQERIYSPYTETTFGYTGEMEDENGLVYLRARYYNRNTGTFMSMDPYEGDFNDPMSLNRYAYAHGNPVNLVDPTGLYSCTNEAGNIQEACDELDQALRRASQESLVFQNINDTVRDGMVLLRNLEAAAEQTFGARFTLRLPDSILGQAGLNIDVNECSTAPDTNLSAGNFEGNALNLTKQSVLRAVAALAHISARFSETGVPVSGVRQWLGQDTIEFLSDSTEITGPFTGYVQLDPPNNIINLGSQVSVGTIVHELGHSFDRVYNLRASSPIRGLFLLRDTARPTYDSTAPGAPNSTQNGNGMLARASTSTAQEEVWADMFMTWVLHGQGNEAIVGSGQIIGWDGSWPRDARFKEVYTWLTARRLTLGIGGPPPANASNEEKLEWVNYVSSLAFRFGIPSSE